MDEIEVPVCCKKGYKVLSAGRNSAICNQYIHYPKHVRAYPKLGDGPLAVFDTHILARLWAANFSFLKVIVRCYYSKSSHTHLWNTDGYGNLHNSLLLPVGTVLADWVECLE